MENNSPNTPINPEQLPQKDPQQLSPTGGILMGCLFMAIGLLIILVGTGVVHTNPGSLHAPGWVIVCVGLVFVFFAAMLINIYTLGRDSNGNIAPIPSMPPKAKLIQNILALCIMAAMALICGWIAFGSGERQFTVSSSFSETSPSNPALGRTIFGAGFGLLVLVFVFTARKIIQNYRKEILPQNSDKIIQQLEAEGFTNVRVVPIPPNQDLPEHTHDEHSVHVILTGGLTITEKNVTSTYRPGDRIDFPSGTTHKARGTTNDGTMIIGVKSH